MKLKSLVAKCGSSMVALVYEYTLKIIAILGGNIMISLLIGFGLGVPLYCMMLLFSIIVLRSDAGGYHADNMWVCYFLSCMGLMGALLWIKAEIPYQALITVCMAVPSYFFVFRNAPLEAENKDNCHCGNGRWAHLPCD